MTCSLKTKESEGDQVLKKANMEYLFTSLGVGLTWRFSKLWFLWPYELKVIMICKQQWLKKAVQHVMPRWLQIIHSCQVPNKLLGPTDSTPHYYYNPSSWPNIGWTKLHRHFFCQKNIAFSCPAPVYGQTTTECRWTPWCPFPPASWSAHWPMSFNYEKREDIQLQMLTKQSYKNDLLMRPNSDHTPMMSVGHGNSWIACFFPEIPSSH